MMRAAIATLLAVACVRGASAQHALPAAGLDSAASAQIGTIVDGAHAIGLPTERIVAKVQRGLFVHAPAPKIVAAARAVADRLAVARTALAPAPSPADIEAGEDALSLGVNEAALKAIREASPNQSVAVPLGVLAQLVTSGVPTKRATDMVTQLIRRGATSEQLVALGRDVDFDVERGAKADASLDARMHGLTAVLAPGTGFGANAAATAPSSTQPTGPKKP